MRTFAIALVAFSTFSILPLSSCAKQKTSLPKPIADHHQKHFVASKITNWMKSKQENGSLFLIEFYQDDLRQEAYYHSSGELRSHLIYLNDTPDAISTLIAKTQPKAEIMRVVKRVQFKNDLPINQLYTILIRTSEGIQPVSIQYQSEEKASAILADL